MKISTKWLLAIGAVACALLLAGKQALADMAWDIEATTPGNTYGVTYDGNGDGVNNQAIVTALVGVPTTLNARTYTTYIWFAADASGSLDIYDNTASRPTSTLAVGDVVSVTGRYSPFSSVPELEGPITAASYGLTGQTPLTPGGLPPVLTIPLITANPGNTLNTGVLAEGGSPESPSPGNGVGDADVAGYYLEVQDVWIGGGGANWNVYPQAGNVAYTITDQVGNTMTMYYYITSYERCSMLMSNSVGIGTVDIYGFVDSFLTTTTVGSTIISNYGDELVPMAIVQVPEPSSFLLAGVGLLSVLAVIRRRRS